MQSDVLGVILSGLWHNTFNLVELDEIMRQKEDLHYANLLNAQMLQFISKFQERLIDQQDKYSSEALHMYASKEDVHKHNTTMLQQLQTNHITKTVITKTFVKLLQTFIKRGKLRILVNNLLIAKNARVMLNKNVDIADGLVNGATGLALDIVFFLIRTIYAKSCHCGL